LNTKYGFIDDLKVPGDREGNFRTMVFEPYRRSVDIEDMILALYSSGISTRRISLILDEIFHGRYSKSTISKITDIVKEEIDEWQSRKLKEKIFYHIHRCSISKSEKEYCRERGTPYSTGNRY